MKSLIQTPVNKCIPTLKVKNGKPLVCGTLFFMRDVKPHIRSILTFIKKTVDQKSENNRIIIRAKALYLCECGNTKEIIIDSVKSGKAKSCGCLSSRNMDGLLNKTHGLRSHPLYVVWAGIKARCLNKNSPVYKHYGGRGVKISELWANDFISFYEWAISNGWVDGLQVDKDMKGDGLLYSPETCSIVTPKANCNKRRACVYITYNGQTKTVSEWCEDLGIANKNMVYDRIKRYGWSGVDAITKPIKGK